MNIFIKLVQSSRAGLQAQSACRRLASSHWAEVEPNLEYTVAKHHIIYNYKHCCRFCTWHSAQIRKKEKKILVLYKTILFFNNEIPLSMKYIKL